jgi:hypothetical protein
MLPIPGVTRHARQRAVERFGRDLAPEEWREIVSAIIERRALLTHRLPDGSEFYVYDLGGVRVWPCWRPDKAIIVTMQVPGMGVNRAVRAGMHLPPRFEGRRMERRRARGCK